MKRKPVTGLRYRNVIAEMQREVAHHKFEAATWRNAFAIVAHGSPEHGIPPNADVAAMLAELDRRMALEAIERAKKLT